MLFIGKHMCGFGLINMNGRLYDPYLQRFLSPDNYVQSPFNGQSYNRYGYCLNNPLMYTGPSGELFWIIPNISWSKNGGLSIGISFVFGIPGGASIQFGGGYNFKSGDAYAYGGATFAFNTVSISYSTSGGWSAGYTAGASPFSGLPVSTNFLTVGANYNITHDSWSGNVSAWQVDQQGWSFNPSISAMILPEHTTNFVRGQGFRSNNSVLSRFVAAGNQQGALDYWGFKGKYVGGEDQSSFWFNKKDHSKYGINYRDGSFVSYDALLSTYMKESYHMRRFEQKGLDGFELGDSDIFDIAKMPEERLGVIHQYKNQGLYWRDIYNYLSAIGNTESFINSYNSGLYNTPYSYTPYSAKWWHFIYKIPRRW